VKNRVFFAGNKFVNTYGERDKKILKSAIFGVQVAAALIDLPSHKASPFA